MTVITCSCHPSSTDEWIVLVNVNVNVKSFKESCSNGCSVLFKYYSNIPNGFVFRLWFACLIYTLSEPGHSGWKPKGLGPSIMRINDDADLAVFIVE